MKNKMLNYKVLRFIKRNYLFLTIFILGIFLRAYKYKELFMYSHDQDLASWVIIDIVNNGHLRLIGQETSATGVFIGGLFYYLLIPFYFFAKMDPIAGVLLPIILGTCAILSIYWVFKRIFEKKVALAGMLIYACSFNIVFTDREVVPTMPVILWSMWYLYSVWLLLKGEQKWGFLLSGVLIGLIWHINLALLVLTIILPISIILSKKKLNLKYLISGLVAMLTFSIPLILFELRHNFIQTKSIFFSLVAKDKISVSHAAKLDRVLQLVVTNIGTIFGTNFFPIKQIYIFWLLLIILGILIAKKAVDRRFGGLMLIWLLIYVLFFTFNAINVSEYYLNGMAIIWILIASLFVSELLKVKNYRDYGYTLLIAFVLINLFKFINLPINKSGYVYKNELISFIKEDSQKHGFPCVSVSYITTPGNDLGYRYLFRIQGIHVNRPDSGSPVYTIVFPHSMVGRFDESFGALGLILPNYKQYDQNKVKESCMGEDSNLTDPLFGYTD